MYIYTYLLRYFVEGCMELYLSAFDCVAVTEPEDLAAHYPALLLQQQQMPGSSNSGGSSGTSSVVATTTTTGTGRAEGQEQGEPHQQQELQLQEDVMLWFVNEGTLGCFKDIVLSAVKFEPVLVKPRNIMTYPSTSISNSGTGNAGTGGGGMGGRSRSNSAATQRSNNNNNDQQQQDDCLAMDGWDDNSSQSSAPPGGYYGNSSNSYYGNGYPHNSTTTAGHALASSGASALSVVGPERPVRHVLVGSEGSSLTVLHDHLPFAPPYVGCWLRFKRFGAYTNSLASTDISEAKHRKAYFWCTHS